MQVQPSYITIVDENKRVVRVGGGEKGYAHLSLKKILREPDDGKITGLLGRRSDQTRVTSQVSPPWTDHHIEDFEVT